VTAETSPRQEDIFVESLASIYHQHGITWVPETRLVEIGVDNLSGRVRHIVVDEADAGGADRALETHAGQHSAADDATSARMSGSSHVVRQRGHVTGFVAPAIDENSEDRAVDSRENQRSSPVDGLRA